MCGFVSVVDPTGTLSMELLESMRDRLAHRGPDGSGAWIGRTGIGVVGLGHRRLSIIDLSRAAAQPMFTTDGGLVIVYNGEIYNFVELRLELESQGAVFRTRSDTEVLLKAYEHWNVECLKKLNGMFAFAIWDGRRQELFVARDRFGEKPLFFAQLPSGGIAVASEMKALFAHPSLEASADEKGVDSYVKGLYYEDDEATLFVGIKRLPPAHAMIVDSRGMVIGQWRYWTPDYSQVRGDYDEHAAVRVFRERMERSVRMRLRSDVPIGTSLSGGLDSSFLVCQLSLLRQESELVTQKTFTARFDDDPTISEGPQVDVVVAHSGVKAFSVTPDPRHLMEESQRLHWHQEEPFLSASIYLQWCVMRLARDQDTTVLLDGQGADELLAGYQYYFRSYQLDRLDQGELWRLVVDTLRFNRRLQRVSRGYADSRRRFDARIGLSWRELFRYWRRPPAPYAGAYDVGVPRAAPGHRLRRQVAEALQYNSLPVLLRYADRNAMAFGRETRFPFLDHDLVDWCVSLPDHALVRRGWQKYILRKAADGILPHAIQWRADKVGYAAPLDVWLRGPLKAWGHDRLFSGPIRVVPGYDRKELDLAWQRHQQSVANLSWELWRWISLNEWLRLLGRRAWNHPTAA